MIEFRFRNLRSDRVHFDHPADVLIGIIADFELTTERGVLYSEADFPVVELAVELSNWLREGAKVGADFEFDSMETPEPGWVWIRRTDTGWRLGSIHQADVDITSRELGEVQSAIGRYLASLDAELQTNWGLRLDAYFQAGHDG